MTSALRVLWPFLRRQWPALLVAGVSTVILAAAEILRPFPLKFIIDHLFASAASADFSLGFDEVLLLAAVAGLVLAIALVEAAAGYFMDVKLARAGERTVHDLRLATYAQLQRLSLGFHRQRHTGDLVTRVTGDVSAVGSLLSSSVGTLVTAGLTLVGMVVVGFLLDPLLALLAFATAPLILIVAFRFRRRMGVLQRRQRKMEGEIASLATESLGSIEQVMALGSERHEHKRLEEKSEERLEAGYEATMVEGRFTRLIDFLGAIGTALVLVVGVFRVGDGALSPGDLVVMVTYVRRVYRPMRAMAREWVRFSRAMARAERVAELLSADELLEDRSRRVPPEPAPGALTFEDVSFAYTPDRPALSGVSLAIPAGQRVALVGVSGAGKSTLAALAARFYDPSSGRVVIDGVDARDLPLAWLREHVGLVLQDPVLFSGTVAENIGWGLDAGRDEIVRAATAVGADSFIDQLPDGYDNELDPGGTGLSGGQMQRLAIARALLRNPVIVILDEPTTGLDAEGEAEVLAGLDVLMANRTTIIITHALALASRAERIAVLEAGRLVQSGPPAELLGESGPFRRLAEEQGLVTPRARSHGGRPRRHPPISDPGLPQLQLMLDPHAVAPVLERSFDGGAPLDVSVRYLRYKPGTNLVVQYEVATNGARHDAIGMIVSGTSLAQRARNAESLALAELVGARAGAVSPLAYEADVDGLFQWYPLDLTLPALACPPDELRNLLRDAGLEVEQSDDEPERLAYKPRRRAVLRLDGHVVKLYRRPEEFERAVVGQDAASRMTTLSTPRLEAVLADRLMTVQSSLAGRSLNDATDAAAAAGTLLAQLHSSPVSGLPELFPIDQLQAAGASARLVATITPELRPRLELLLRSLSSSLPEEVDLVPSHGDFNARQLLDNGGTLTPTDFDEFCLAPAALDPATYAAYLVGGRSGDLDLARAALDRLLAGYGAPIPHLDWYLATMILRRAARPFRYLEPEWPTRVAESVTAAVEAAR